MTNRRFFRPAIAYPATILLPLLLVLPAKALSMKECSARYKAAQSAGEAKDISWSDFRKAQCNASVDADAAENPGVSKPKEAETADAKPKNAGGKTEPETRAAAGTATFPSSISSKFAGEKPARARMQTCLEQYRANKNAGRLGGTRWIEKGGGYYAQCNARLKAGGA